MADKVRATVLVSGKVQGVFYRATAMGEAQRLGLTGVVRNLADGAVEAIIEGDRAQVDEFIAWCRMGPPAARVESVEVKLAEPRDEFRTFTIDR